MFRRADREQPNAWRARSRRLEWLESARTGATIAAALFAALLVWLWLVPSSRLYPDGRRPRWWKSPRFWAAIVAAIQMMVYLLFG